MPDHLGVKAGGQPLSGKALRNASPAEQRKEVAAQFGISERTVEVQLARGMKHCADYLLRRGVRGFFCDE